MSKRGVSRKSGSQSNRVPVRRRGAIFPAFLLHLCGKSLLREALFTLLTAVLLSCVSSGSIAARSPGVTRMLAPDADLGALIDGLQNKYSRIRGIAADFIQVYQGNDGRRIRETGRLLLKRPGKARWEYTEPEHKLFISDGSNV